MLTLDHLLGLLGRFKYAAMFGILFLCGLGLPVPEEVTLVGTGLAVGWDKADFWLASAACVAGILAGDSIVFALGRYRGKWFLSSRPMRWLLTESRQQRIWKLFARHGNAAVFFTRFIAGLRIGVYAYAGQHGMAWARFLFLDLCGALISGPTSIWVGAFAARKLADPKEAEEYARHILSRGSHVLYAAVGLLVLFIVAHWLWGRRSAKKLAREAKSPPAKPAQPEPEVDGVAVGSSAAPHELERDPR